MSEKEKGEPKNVIFYEKFNFDSITESSNVQCFEIEDFHLEYDSLANGCVESVVLDHSPSLKLSNDFKTCNSL